MYIIPKPGIKLWDPISKKLVPAEGLDVQPSTFWNRRKRDGDIDIYTKKPEPTSENISGAIS